MPRNRDAIPVVLMLVSAVVGQQLFLPQLGPKLRSWISGEREAAFAAPAVSTTPPITRCSVPFIASSITSGFGVVAEYHGTAGLAAEGLVVETPGIVIRARNREERLWAVEVGLAKESTDRQWSIVRSGDARVIDRMLAPGEVLEPGGHTWLIAGVTQADLADGWLVFSHVLEDGGQRAWTYAHADRASLLRLTEAECAP
jgi:hypothetical protein